MFAATKEAKVLRDPIHGYIHVNYQVIWDCINSSEMQRLRRIHQLGGVYQIYHTAEHSRFSHSLGVYEIVRRMVEEVEDLRQRLSEEEKIQVMCAGLLHDCGHGPFSHFFENEQTISHEERTMRLILDPKTEINQALTKESSDLPLKVVSILQGKHENPMLHQMISSQLDADRMDYLLRDAYETGTSYGTFDIERILRTMRVENNTLCMKESGMHSVEDYIMARYHMYWQVYLHPDVKAYELLIHSFFKRIWDIENKEDLGIFSTLKKEMDNQEFLRWDETVMGYGFHQALESNDAILADLADRLLNRHLFEWIEQPSDEQIEQVRNQLTNQEKLLEYYYHENQSQESAYMPYKEADEPIWIVRKNGQLNSLSTCSEIVKALLRMETKSSLRIYFG